MLKMQNQQLGVHKWKRRGMLEGGTVSTFKRVCVLLSVLGGGTATISILNQECVLMSIFGGGATISIFNCVCVLMSMLGGGTAIQQKSPS